MKAFAVAVVGMLVIALGASYVLRGIKEASSDRYAMPDVRLDADMRSDERFPE